MAGTGIHGYTGTSSDGKYNIVNGQIVSQNPTYSSPAYTSGGSAIANRNGAVMDTASSQGLNVSQVASSLGSSIANAITGAMSSANSGLQGNAVDYAKQISNIVSQSNSDYGDMIREILANQDANTAKSQAFAREQMDYQTRSDQAAMSWSAQEAQKNRDWQENLSNQAHQREVRDLIAAGLNPILSANNGAYTGSGATGQGFSSSGSMGNVDTSGTNAIGSLMSTVMNTASQAAIAKMYTDAERYSADLQYSSSRLATEAGILNNQNTNSSTRQNVLSQIEADLERTKVQGEYGLKGAYINQDTSLGVAGMNNATDWDIAKLNDRGQDRRTNLQQQGENYRTSVEQSQANARNKYQVDNGSLYSTGGIKGMADDLVDLSQDAFDALYKKWKAMEKRGLGKGSVLGKVFGYG